MRIEKLFDEGWLFHKGELPQKLPSVKGPIYSSAKTEQMKWGPAAIAYNDNPDDYRFGIEYNTDRWETVSLPHDYIISGEVKAENNPALGFFDYVPAWYRKHFFGEEVFKNHRVSLLFDGIATVSTIYLNGILLKHNFSGFNSFEVDITDFIKYEEDNVLAVHVEPHGHEGWWYEGGGIYRHVHLTVTDPVCFDLWGIYIAPCKTKGGYRLETEATVYNSSFTRADYSVMHHVLNSQKEEILAYETAVSVLPPCEKETLRVDCLLPAPHLWDIDDPFLYTLVSEIICNGEVTDRVENRFGCREYRIDPQKGFFLNGRSVKIKGVCTHQDFGLTGKAVPDNILRYKAHLMKEMGANGVRMSHYMHPVATMDALDELGFIVLDETRWFSSIEEAVEQMTAVIKRDRNRPSVFMWSLGNEEPHHATDIGRRINRSLMAAARKLDRYRPMTSAVDRPPETATIFPDVDLIGINYNPYKLDMAHEMYPDIPIFSSECCATGTTRGWYETADDPAYAYISAYDHTTNASFISRESFWKMVMERDWLFGAYQWIAFEHRGEATWPRLCSQSGAIDLYLQKKDAFYQNLSHWSETPVIHLLPHWNFQGREDETIQVFCYTNLPKAELFLNGNSLGRVEIEPWGHGVWQVSYQPGELTVVGYDADGIEVLRESHVTSGRGYRLLFREDCPADNNGCDMALYTCYVADKEGREVPDACPLVSFHVVGDAQLIGTGSDISDHTPVTSPVRRMRAGAILVGIKVRKDAGSFILRAESENLICGSIKKVY